MVEVRGRDDVPGAASQRTRLESGTVGDAGDDHFHDFIWEAAGRFAGGMRSRKWTAECAIDLGFPLTPDGHHATREVYPCRTNDAEVRAVHIRQRVAVLDTEDAGLTERPTSPVVGDTAIVVSGRVALRSDRTQSGLATLRPRNQKKSLRRTP